MKKFFTTALVVMLPLLMLAQGWPAQYGGVMLQGFYWDSFADTRWTRLESQADELAEFFSLVWVPQSAYCGGQSMGYDDLYWLSNYNSSFGNEQELRSMINTFKQKGIGTIADVVINHRKSINDWVTFPAETYKGVSYRMESTDICRNDDGGATLTWANNNGKSLSPNNDTGEDWGGMRDLDHKSANVQKIVKAYLDLLLNDLGYAGFRYDMTKGYAATYTGQYNSAVNAQYSVGEYWDGNISAVRNWIDGTKIGGVVQSAAFDFPFRYTIRDAVNNNRWSNLGGSGKGLCLETNYKRYAVTFVENHDTQIRSATDQQDPIRYNIEAANAYLLAMPGTPCIFLKHWQDYKESIKQMIYVRQLAGITNTSTSYNMANQATQNYYVQRTSGANNISVLAAMGSTAYQIPSTHVVLVSGTNYRLALSKTAETAWVSKPSGEYGSPFEMTLTAVSQTDGAKLVYTVDGTEPTASNGTKVNDGSTVTINKTCTFKVGLLINGAVTGVITRHYDFFDPYEITVFLKDPTVAPNNWARVNYFSWDETGSPNGNWPGQTITDTKIVKGVKFYYCKYTITGKSHFMNFVFNQGGANASSYQTEDVTHVNQTSFFEIASQTNKYKVNDVTDIYLPYLDGDPSDVNGDGEVNIADVNAVITAILGSSAEASCDVNGDGEVNIADVNAVISTILGL